jgi:ATP phosphoribosyltransferase
MNYADIILDLVSTGTTLRENNLKELAGAVIMESEGVLVARRAALLQQPETLAIVREMLERVEAHLKAEAWFTVRTSHIPHLPHLPRHMPSSPPGGVQG